MGQKALLKTFALPWDKKLCNSKFINFRQFDEKYFHSIAFTYVKLTEKPQFCCLNANFRQFDEKLENCAKLFIPWGKKLCKKALQNRLASI